MNYLLCFIFGGLYTLSFSPYNISIFSILSLLFFLMLIDFDDFKSSVLKSLSFSLGYFLIGTYWLDNVIRNFSEINYALSIFLVFLFTLYLSLFFILPFIITIIINKNLKIKKNFLFIILAILITLFEIIRSNIFTGYSWFNFGQAAIYTPLDHFFPIFGVHGLTFIIFLVSIIFLNILKNKDLGFFLILGVCLISVNLFVYDKNWTYKTGKDIKISVIQPNIYNKTNYSDNDVTSRMKILKKLTTSSVTYSPDIILWPESPLPIVYNDLKNNFYKNILLELPSSVSLITGSFFKDNKSIYNSIINITDPSSNIYNKKHLVPFGEYLPLRKLLSNFYNFFNLNIYDIQRGNNTNSLSINNFVAHSLICYESIFSFESLVRDKNVDFILNVSNDGWFGDSLAPYQHLDALIMRSLENQRYSIRSTNTGISAVINPDGTLVEYIDLNKNGIINTKIYSMNGQTPLSIYGHDILYFLFFIVFLYSSIYFNFKLFRRS